MVNKTMRENNITEVQSLALDKINLPTCTASFSAEGRVASYSQLKNIKSSTSVRKIVNPNSVVALCDREQYKDEKKKDYTSLKISASIKVQND